MNSCLSKGYGREDSEVYTVQYGFNYEPYVIAKRTELPRRGTTPLRKSGGADLETLMTLVLVLLPRGLRRSFDENFIAWGLNKVSYYLELQ